eukprot:5289571-Amphidinium_carterae.2
MSSMCHLCNDIAAVWSTSSPMSAVMYCGLSVFTCGQGTCSELLSSHCCHAIAFMCHCVDVDVVPLPLLPALDQSATTAELSVRDVPW